MTILLTVTIKMLVPVMSPQLHHRLMTITTHNSNALRVLCYVFSSPLLNVKIKLYTKCNKVNKHRKDKNPLDSQYNL